MNTRPSFVISTATRSFAFEGALELVASLRAFYGIPHTRQLATEAFGMPPRGLLRHSGVRWQYQIRGGGGFSLATMMDDGKEFVVKCGVLRAGVS